MKKIILLVSLLLILPAISFAVDPLKIGCIDLQKVLYESDTGKKAKSDIDALIKSKQSVLDEKRKTIEKLRGEVEKQASVLSLEAKRANRMNSKKWKENTSV